MLGGAGSPRPSEGRNKNRGWYFICWRGADNSIMETGDSIGNWMASVYNLYLSRSETAWSGQYIVFIRVHESTSVCGPCKVWFSCCEKS